MGTKLSAVCKTSNGLQVKAYMRGESVINDHVSRTALCIQDLLVDTGIRLAYLSVEYRHPFDVNATFLPGVLCSIPEALVRENAFQCFRSLESDMKGARGDTADRDLACFPDAITADQPKTLADYWRGDFGGDLSVRALERAGLCTDYL